MMEVQVRAQKPGKFHFPVKTILRYIVLLIMTLVMLYPLYLMLNISMMSYQEFIVDANQIIPISKWNLDNYISVWEKLDVFRKLINSLVYSLTSTVISCLVSVMAAYPISRNHFRASGKIYGFILISMFLPGSLVATIFLMKNILFLYGSPLCLIVMWGLGGLQMNIFMMVGFIRQLPRDLDEAAWIDGCSYWYYIVRCAVPLMLPIVATVFTFKFVGCWNDFLTPYIYLSDADARPIATGLFYFKGEYSSRWNELSAAIVIVCLPMVILYVFMQKYIIEGMTSGALKG